MSNSRDPIRAKSRRPILKRSRRSRFLSRLEEARNFGRGADERGSLVIALSLLLIASIVLASVANQAFFSLGQATQSNQRNDALQGALAGVQAAVADIRAAVTGSGSSAVGDVANLPCSAIDGTVSSSTSSNTTISYKAQVTYLLQTSSGIAPAATCVQGQGPQPSSPNAAFSVHQAQIISVGGDNLSSSSVISRTENSTYNFSSPTNANIPGGLIYTYPDSAGQTFCAQVGPAYATGFALVMSSSCNASNPSPSLVFSYQQDYTLQTLINGQAYCIVDQGQNGSTTVTNPTDTTVYVAPCTSPAPLSQQWGVNDSDSVEGVNSSGGPNGWCLDNSISSASPAGYNPAGSGTYIGTNCGGGGYATDQTWTMQATVGAGGSNPVPGTIGPTDQLINYAEFGRCIDVTNQDVNFGALIDYTCKQFPNTSIYPIWNQRWCTVPLGSYGEPANAVLLYTPQYTSAGCPSNPLSPQSGVTPYCLTTATDAANNPADKPGGGYPIVYPSAGATAVTVQNCSTLISNLSSQGASALSGASTQIWINSGTTGGSIDNYTYQDYRGYCLEANSAYGVVYPSGFTGASFTMLQVAPCTGNLTQKWNAPPNYGASNIANTYEG